MGADGEQGEQAKVPIVLSRACADLYEDVASVCTGWEDIAVVIDRREGTGEHGFIVPRAEAPEPVPEIPDGL